MTAIKRCCALALAVLMILTALPVTAMTLIGCARDQRLSP